MTEEPASTPVVKSSLMRVTDSFLFRLLIFVGSLSTITALYLWLDGQAAWQVQLRAGYWIMLVLSGLTLWQLWPWGQWREVATQIKILQWGFLTALVVSLLHQFHEIHFFKVIYDEYVLLSVSKAMHESWLAGWIAQVDSVFGAPVAMAHVADKRPLFFPFVLSLLHTLSGYRLENAFVLNGLLGFGLLFGLYIWLRPHIGGMLALVSILIVGGSPLLAQNVTGGGFEVLNLALMVTVLAATSAFVRQPSERSFAVMVLLTALLANTRYESILFAVVPALGLLVVKLRGERICWLPWAAVLSPLTLVSVVLAQRVFHSFEVFYQSDGEAFISLQYFSGNFDRAIYYLFNAEVTQSNSLVISVLGIIAVLLLPLVVYDVCFRQKQQLSSFLVTMLGFSLFVILHTSLILCLRWGGWDDPMVARFTLPLQLFLALSIVVVAHHLKERHGWGERGWLIAAAAAFFFYGIPSISQKGSTYLLSPGYGMDQAIKEIDRLDPDRTRLVISASALPFVVRGHISLPVSALDDTLMQWEKKLLSGRYAEILFVENVTLNFNELVWVSSFSESILHLLEERGERVRDIGFRGDQRFVIWRITVPRFHGSREGLEFLEPIPLPERERLFYHDAPVRMDRELFDQMHFPEQPYSVPESE